MADSFFLAVFELVAAQRDSDDVDVELLNRAHQRAAPAAPDVEQRHPRFEVQLAQGQVELGLLRFLESHVVAFEIRARVTHRRIQK